MHVLWVSALCALAWTQAVSPPSTNSTSPQVPEGTIKIEGSEHPEQIPDHWVWRSGLLKLAEINKGGPESYLEQQLPLSPMDARALFKEADLQPRRDAQCAAAIQSRQRELREQNASPAALARGMNEVTLDCRTKDLDAADRVLDALSEDGRQAVLSWVERLRRSTTVFVPAGDAEIFRLPR